MKFNPLLNLSIKPKNKREWELLEPLLKKCRHNLNFDKPVGALMVAKIAELLDIINDDVSKDKVDVVVSGEGLVAGSKYKFNPK